MIIKSYQSGVERYRWRILFAFLSDLSVSARNLLSGHNPLANTSFTQRRKGLGGTQRIRQRYLEPPHSKGEAVGEHNVRAVQDPLQEQLFVKALLSDIAALERMIEGGQIEEGARRIGAEQEMFLVDRAMRPAPVAPAVLASVADERLTTEIGKFNLEANLSPRMLAGDGLRRMEQELTELVNAARQAALEFNAEIVLTGILPTIRQSDLTIDNITPNPRYYALNTIMNKLRGNKYSVSIRGLDELETTHDNVLMEACCTSFQIHLQVGVEECVRLYNLAQAISAPMLAVSSNSPLLFGRRLWHETRIALFQYATDERSDSRQMRHHPPRVIFGQDWLKQSVIEIFREEVARYRVLLTKEIDEDPLAIVERGELPKLAALRLHNGTVWRWNRPCYGICEGKAHLRIEHRSMPAGPTIIDEMANAALFYGLMMSLPEEYGPIETMMRFDEAKVNFATAARQGLKAQLAWTHGRDYPASKLLIEHLLPLARQGLVKAGVDHDDANRYLDIIQERVERDQTGSLWALRSITGMDNQGTQEIRHRALVEAMLEHQINNTPVHLWPMARLAEEKEWRLSFQTVAQFMSTDLFTVRPDDLIDLAASVMDWKHIRHVPVEDNDGHLIGLVSHRDLLRLLSQGLLNKQTTNIVVKDVMKRNPLTVAPNTPTLEAIKLMRKHQVGSLPVVENGRLVGIVTSQDFLNLSAEIIEKQLKQGEVE